MGWRAPHPGAGDAPRRGDCRSRVGPRLGKAGGVKPETQPCGPRGGCVLRGAARGRASPPAGEGGSARWLWQHQPAALLPHRPGLFFWEVTGTTRDVTSQSPQTPLAAAKRTRMTWRARGKEAVSILGKTKKGP